MKPVEKLLRHLGRTDVLEVAIATGRLPCVKVAEGFKPIDPQALTSEAIYDVLFAAGGSRHVENLSPQPSNWSFRLEGVGTIAVGAIERDGNVQARFAVTKRDAPAKTLKSHDADLSDPFDDGAPAPLSSTTAMGASFGRTSSQSDLEMDLGAALRGDRPAPAARRLSDPFQQAASRGGEPQLSDPFGKLASVPAGPYTAPRLSDPFGSEQPASQPELQLDANPSPRGFAPAHAPADVDFDTVQTRAPEPQAVGTLAYALDFDGRAHVGGGGLALDGNIAGANAFDGTLDSLLKVARKERASDLHVIAGRPTLLRLAGELVPIGEALDPRIVETILVQQIPSRALAGFEKDGSCDFALEHWKYGRFRANIVRQRTGLKGCFRLIGEGIPTLESLRLPEALAAATHHHQGLIVITGPTGHGKTTTLTAIVDLINSTTSHHVICVEDPVEYVHPRKRAMMSQREVGTHTKSFRAALKGSLREDPDVIVIGELRDTETVRIALAASETGHLVIGTMNTPSAAKTIDRMIDLFPPGDQQQVRLTLAGGLKLVVSQRLVPNTDKSGMMAACEVLPGSMALWNLIRDNKTFQIPSLQQRGKALGIIRLDDSLAELVRQGRTTAANVMPFAESPDELEGKIAGRAAAQLPPGMGQPPAKGAPAAAGNGAAGPGAKPQDPAGAGLFSKAANIFGNKKGG